MYPLLLRLTLSSSLLIGSALPALSQNAPETVTNQARDAFGESLGVESVGLYSEVQVRGFDLTQSGAYRIDDHYFARAVGFSEALSGGTTIKVGASAAGLSLPSPSGVVVYRLREAQSQTGVRWTTGLRDFRTPHLETEGTWHNADRSLSVVGTVLWQPETHSSTGQEGRNLDVSAVLSWRPTATQHLRVFGGRQAYADNGSMVILPVTTIVPPPLVAERNYGPDWMRYDTVNSNAGLLYDATFGDWRVGASLTWSQADQGRSDGIVLDIDGDGLARRTVFHTKALTSDARAAEIKLSRTFTTGALYHEVGVAARVRRSQADLTEAAAFNGGTFNIRDRAPAMARPDLPSNLPMGRDEVDQTMTSLTYGLNWPQKLDIRLGAHRSNYQKSTRQPDGLTAQREQDNWLYNASVIVPLRQDVRLFGSYVTGLEESGIAPYSAINRGDILAPVEAKQWEAGVTWDITPNLNFIAAWFDITKPVAGLGSDGRYDLVGDVRHSGYEFSLSGQITEATNVVLGAVLNRPRLSGETVESGQLLNIPAGVSRTNISVNAEHRFDSGWSIDGQLMFEGSRRMLGTATTEVPGVSYLMLGARKTFGMYGRPVTGRFQIVNALDEDHYYPTASHALFPVWRRTFRLTFSSAF